ncbi:hypothetical protein B6U74_02925 [Candidatus Bathyarchaeota archaeon ex4484_205]|nr:MAG: hypothetical protein B6U74_02925 [Candidatus Bathyarchaeota archaeon ex4484_205]
MSLVGIAREKTSLAMLLAGVHEVYTVRDGVEAFEKAKEIIISHNPQLILIEEPLFNSIISKLKNSLGSSSSFVFFPFPSVEDYEDDK